MARLPNMARPTVRSPLQFKGDPGARTLLLIAVTAAFFASAAILVSLAATDLVSQWRWAFDGTLTVQIPATDDPENDTARAASLATALNSMAEVDRARALGPREVERMVEPWLGSLEGASGLPLPRLIDIRLADVSTAALAAVERRVISVVPEAILDDHGRWIKGLARLALTVESVAIIVLALVGLAVVLAVSFAVRTALSLHRETVEILHLMGAEDGYIAGLFAGLAFRRCFLGGVIGLVIALLVILIGGQIGSGAGAVLPALSIGVTGWLMTLSTPLGLALVAWLVARVSTRAALRQQM